MLCKCNNEAKRNVVKKEGKNKGRVFYNCINSGQPETGYCNFMEWDAEAPGSDKPKESPTKKVKVTEDDKGTEGSKSPNIKENIQVNQDAKKSQVTQNDSEETSKSSKKLCKCKIAAKRNVVKKEGKNQGRVFYNCINSGQPETGYCNFHEWDAEEPKESPTKKIKATEDDKGSEGSTSEDSEEASSPILCKCKNTAKRNVVKKEGKNKGRAFYNCLTNGAGRCNFWEWDGETPANK